MYGDGEDQNNIFLVHFIITWFSVEVFIQTSHLKHHDASLCGCG